MSTEIEINSPKRLRHLKLIGLVALLAATVATLFIVPVFYTLLRRKPPRLHELDAKFAAEAAEG